MDSPTGSLRRHGRNPSDVKRVPLSRHTKGPLDADEYAKSFTWILQYAERQGSLPVEMPVTPSGSVTSISRLNTRVSQSSRTPQSSLLSPDSIGSPKPRTPSPRLLVDLRFLQDPGIYHQLPTQDIPKAFLESGNQPPLATPLKELLSYGHYRRAAAQALVDLMRAVPSDQVHLLQLLYTRLACLTLISRPDLAAQEALPLIDFLARNPPGAREILPLIPWELRLLLVRLQSIGAGDGGRRGIMSMYALASEVRANLKAVRQAGRADEEVTWKGRLSDLGLKVADELVEMGELETARKHLDTLMIVPDEESAVRRALLLIRLGDIDAAKSCVAATSSEDDVNGPTEALLHMANGDYSASVSAWRQLHEENPDDGMISQNLAVCLLYTGLISEARDLLEQLSDAGPAFPGLLFNLATVYELCTEKSVQQKTLLAERMAAKTPSTEGGGWERTGADFKL